MTTLTFAQVKKLLTTVSKTVPDQLTCDGCFDLIAEFADAEIRGNELSDALKEIKIHFSQWPRCAFEYAMLLEALQEPNSASN